jgi:(p)ppGpp synthase/HD superfamily hydrolase
MWSASMAGLEDAILLATKAHLGQTDKAGAPYILHPLRVMMRCRTAEAMMAAVLHDVVEDTPITLEDLQSMGFPAPVINAVACLTKREGEPYEAFVARVKANALATEVKIADIEDNMDVRRLTSVGPADAARLERYRRAYRDLTGR